MCGTHKGCVLTRNSYADKRAARRGVTKGGRPLGFMAAWLAAGEALPDKRAHWQPAQFDIDYETRVAARVALSLCGGGAEVLAMERELVDDVEGAERCMDSLVNSITEYM